MGQNPDEEKPPIHLVNGLFSNATSVEREFKFTSGKVMLQDKK